MRELPLLSDYLGAACFGGLGQDAISATRWPGSSTKSLFPTEPLISYLQHGDNTTYLMEILRTSNINFPSSFLCKTCSLPFFPKRDANPGKVERQLGWVCPKAKGLNFCYTLDLPGSIWKSMKVFSALQCCLPPSFWMPLGPSYLSGRNTNMSLGHNAVIRSNGFNVLTHLWGPEPEVVYRGKGMWGKMPLEKKKGPDVLLKLARTVAKLSATDPRRIIPKYRFSRQLWQGEVRVTG